MRYSVVFLPLFLAMAICSCSQTNSQKQQVLKTGQARVGRTCETCEAIYEQAPDFARLNWVDTLPDFSERGPKLVVSGVIYKPDGKTPAPNIILYVYHTDQTGHYTPKDGESGSARRHGYIRGWMKTNARGQYKFYTLLPGHYPGTNIPAHIHPIIKEPDKNEYWIDEYRFDDDKFLTAEERRSAENRGGNGIMTLEKKNGVLYGERNIYLGRNIPDYPIATTAGLESGLDLGDNCPAFDPLHLSGADAGKYVCPMCKYGYGRGIMVWFNQAHIDTLRYYVKTLETEMERRGEKNLRVFIIYMNPTYNVNGAIGQEVLRGKLIKWCNDQGLAKVALLWVPSPVDQKTCGVFRINPGAQNTVFIYKKRKIAAKWINVDYSEKSLKQILEDFDKG